LNGLRVDKKTFESLSVKKQLGVLFDCIEDLRNSVRRKNKTDTVVTAIMGFLGGIVAVAGKWFFLRGG